MPNATSIQFEFLFPIKKESLFEFRGALYGFVGIRLREYAMHARPISSRWDTLAIPTHHFRQLAAGIDEFLFLDDPAVCQGEPMAPVRKNSA